MTAEQTTTCYRHPDRETKLACSTCGKFICVDCSIDAAVGQRCPDCQHNVGTTRVQRMQDISALDGAPVTRAIMVIAIGLFVIGWFSPQANEWLLNNLAQFNLSVSQGQVWQLFTAAFLHAPGLWHIGFNMYALYLFGPQIERELGGWAFGAMYTAAAVGGGFAAYVLGGPRDLLVGASGAIFGLFGVWFLAAYRQRQTGTGRARFNQMLLIMGVNAAIPLVFRQISWEGHLGGFLVGIGLFALWQRVGRRNTTVLAAMAFGTAAILMAVVAIF